MKNMEKIMVKNSKPLHDLDKAKRILVVEYFRRGEKRRKTRTQSFKL